MQSKVNFNPSLGSESKSVENSSSAAIRVENHTDSSNRVDTTSNSETNEGVVKPNAVKGQLHNPSLGSESKSVENSSSAAIRVENHTDSSNRVDTTSNSETNEGVVKPNAVKGQLHNPSLGSESKSVENSSSAAIRVENHTDSSNHVDTTSNSETNEVS